MGTDETERARPDRSRAWTGRPPGAFTSSSVLAAAAVAGVVVAPSVVDPFAGAAGPFGPVLPIVVLWAYVGVGLAAWRLSPSDGTGRVLVAMGAAWGGALLVNAGGAGRYTTGFVALAGLGTGLSWVVLRFGDQREAGRWARGVGAANVVTLVGWGVVVPLVHDPRARGCANCPPPPDLLTLPVPPGVAAVVVATLGVLMLATMAVTAAVVAWRWWRASPAVRWQVTPVYAPAILSTCSLIAYLVRHELVGAANPTPPLGRPGITVVYFMLGMGTLPFGMMVALRRRRSQRVALGELVGSLGSDGAVDELEAALRTITGDTRLAILTGPEVRLTAAPTTPLPDTVTTPLRADGSVLGWLRHDVALSMDPGLLAGAVAVSAQLLAHHELARQAQERLSDVAASRRRIVRAADEARRRIERDLHDGAQQRLVAVSLAVRDLLDRVTTDAPAVAPDVEHVAEQLDEAIEELRELARGMYPPALTAYGLAAALEGLALRSPVPIRLEVSLPARLPSAIEATAWFVALEGVTNAVRHAGCREVTIAATVDAAAFELLVRDDGVGGADPSGGGLRGLADRVAAVGGRFSVASPPGAGTVLRVHLPPPPAPVEGTGALVGLQRDAGAGGPDDRITIVDDVLVVPEEAAAPSRDPG